MREGRQTSEIQTSEMFVPLFHPMVNHMNQVLWWTLCRAMRHLASMGNLCEVRACLKAYFPSFRRMGPPDLKT